MILSKLSHPNILAFHGLSVVDSGQLEIALVTELMEQGSLDALLSTKNIPFCFRLQIAVDSSQGYTEKCDVFSFGTVLCELFSGAQPYAGMNLPIDQLIYKIIHEHLRPILPPDLPPMIQHVITECFAENPVLRPSFLEIWSRLSRLMASEVSQAAQSDWRSPLELIP